MKRFPFILCLVASLALFNSCQWGIQSQLDPNAEINFDGTGASQPKQGNKGGSKNGAARTGTVTPVGPQGSVDRLPVYQGAGRKVSSVNVSGKYVALTFDDGPHATNTPRVLDILKKYNAKGTFFVQGQNVNRYPAIVARTIREGNEIGSHSWNHPDLRKLGASAVKSQLDKTNAAINAAYPGYRPRTIRPPYGGINTTLVNYFAHDYGMSTIMWSIDTNDWRKPGVQTIINRAVNGARPGSIILVHDIHASTCDAIEGIVSGLIARGYTLVTVSQLMAMQVPVAAPAAGSAPQVVSGPAPVAPAPQATPLPAPTSAPAPIPVVPESVPVPTLPSIDELNTAEG